MSEILTYAEFQRNNFFRKPEWRWERVTDICRQEGARCSKRDDKMIRKAKAFHVAREKIKDPVARTQLFWDEPGLFYAYEIQERLPVDPAAAFYLQARLLARQTHEQIAKEMSTIPATVKWYEALYFNVSDAIDARDWITKQVLVPALVRQQYIRVAAPQPDDDEDNMPRRPILVRDSEVAMPFMDGTLKMMAYFGGPMLVDFLIHGMRSGQVLKSLEDLPSWFDAHWSNTIRRRSLQASVMFEINKYNVSTLFDTHLRLMEMERSEDAKNQQRSTHERNIAALLDEIPWSVGAKGTEQFKGTKLGKLDEGACEPRDSEILQVSAGDAADDLDADWPTEMPPPRKRDGKTVAAEIKL